MIFLPVLTALLPDGRRRGKRANIQNVDNCAMPITRNPENTHHFFMLLYYAVLFDWTTIPSHQAPIQAGSDGFRVVSSLKLT